MASKKKNQPTEAKEVKMVELSEAMSTLKNLAHHVIFGNEESRKVLFDFIKSFPEDADVDLYVDILLEVFVQDEEYRIKMDEELNDNPIAQDILDTVYELRAILNFDALDYFMEEVNKRMAEESEKN